MVTKEEVLKELGLSDKEVAVYLSLLMIGQSTVNFVANKAALNRVTTYDILKALKEKGYVSYVIKSGVKHFEAAEPSKFLDDLKEKEEKVESVLDELQRIKSTLVKKPEIEVYEGIKGLKSIFNDILKEKKKTLWIGAPIMLEKLQFYFPHFIREKRKIKMFSKVITTDNKSMRKYYAANLGQYVKYKFVDKKINVTKIIYGNKVAHLTFKEKDSIGILIHNKQIAESERNMFDLLF